MLHVSAQIKTPLNSHIDDYDTTLEEDKEYYNECAIACVIELLNDMYNCYTSSVYLDSRPTMSFVAQNMIPSQDIITFIDVLNKCNCKKKHIKIMCDKYDYDFISASESESDETNTSEQKKILYIDDGREKITKDIIIDIDTDTEDIDDDNTDISSDNKELEFDCVCNQMKRQLERSITAIMYSKFSY